MKQILNRLINHETISTEEAKKVIVNISNDMYNPSQYHKALVNSGRWLLYRNDPRRKANNKTTFQLDSQSPNITLKEHLSKEKRFLNIVNSNNETQIDKFQLQVNERLHTLEQLKN